MALGLQMLKAAMRGFVSALLAVSWYLLIDATFAIWEVTLTTGTAMGVMQLALDEGGSAPCPLALLVTARWLENVILPGLAALFSGVLVSFWSKIRAQEMLFQSLIFGLLLALTFGDLCDLSRWIGVILSHFVLVGGVTSFRLAILRLRTAEWRVRNGLRREV